jgi:hypothetical protein
LEASSTMSDNRRRFVAIHQALKQLFPTEPKGNVARHLTTLAMLISGIVGGKQVHLPQIANKVPSSTKLESRVKRFSRFVANCRIDIESYYFPYARQILANLAHQPLVLIMDSSPVGRKCRTLMLSVVYKKRALPLVWLVAEGSSGHFSEADHMTLIKRVNEILPDEAEVICLGDGEFDGISLQASLDGYGFKYVCRTAKDTLLTRDGQTLTFEKLGVTAGMRITVVSTTITRERYGPVQAIAWWAEGEENPLYLVSNLSVFEDPCDWYALRFYIETLFSDQKSRGFHLHKSHLSDPQRIAQLMIAACLGYIWMIYLGQFAMQIGWDGIIHRTDRCDLSLFQLGMRALEYCMNQDMGNPCGI